MAGKAELMLKIHSHVPCNILRVRAREFMLISKTMSLAAEVKRTFSRPEGAVERSVLNCLGYVLRFNSSVTFQIGNGSGDLENPIMRTGAQALLRNRPLQQSLTIGREFTSGSDLTWSHLCVAVNPVCLETLQLNIPGLYHPLSNGF